VLQIVHFKRKWFKKIIRSLLISTILHVDMF